MNKLKFFDFITETVFKNVFLYLEVINIFINTFQPKKSKNFRV